MKYVMHVCILLSVTLLMTNTEALASSALIDRLIDGYERELQSLPREHRFHSFEKEVSAASWAHLLEDCFKQERSESARLRILSIIQENKLNADDLLPVDDAMAGYCAHVLQAASLKGVAFDARPTAINDPEARTMAMLLNECYDIHDRGIQAGLRSFIAWGLGEMIRLQGMSALEVHHAANTHSVVCTGAMRFSGDVSVDIRYD